MSGKTDIAIGGAILAVGLVITFGTMGAAGPGGGYTVAYGAIIGGIVYMLIGLFKLTSGAEDVEEEPASYEPVPAKLILSRLTADDYPPEALAAGVEGRVLLDFMVDDRGEVRDVRLAESSGNEALDAGTIAIFADRHSFQPAYDAYGRAVPERRRQAVRWRLPADA